MQLMCFKQRVFSLPSARWKPRTAFGRRNAPEVCRNTRRFRRWPPGMQLKPFNRRPISLHRKLPPVANIDKRPMA
jgi:hypothetical protein